MADTRKSEQRASLVRDILMSINEAIGESGALELVEDGTGYVPYGLRQGVARTALFMLQEARKRKPMTPDEIEAARQRRAEAKAKANQKKKMKARMAAAEKKGLKGSELRARLAKSDLRKKDADAPPPKRDDAGNRASLFKQKKGGGEIRGSRMPHPGFGRTQPEHERWEDAKEKDIAALEKERKRRGSFVTKRAGKLARMRGRHRLLRDPEHDVAKGYDRDEPRTTGPSAAWKGHAKDPDTGEVKHSSGKKENKKFANATTFGNSDDDAMLHTDNSKEGARGSADKDEFVFHGDLDKDPRQKWYRVSKEGGYASAMASLRKVYGKDPSMRQKVMSKVKSTGFVGADGKQIHVRPTGALHNERGGCVRKKTGRLTALGKTLKRHNPSEFYRLCKGSHAGAGGTAMGRSEYGQGFDPRHDDAHKVRKLHKAAEAGKADKPERNIAQHMAARPGRRKSVERAIRSVGRKATRAKWKMRNRG